jgi:hypothetical protein
MAGYALSCLLNVVVLRRPQDTSAGESTSGRSYWENKHGREAGHWSWALGVWLIDALFFWDRQWRAGRSVAHCELSDERDYLRAKEKVRRYEARAAEGYQGAAACDMTTLTTRA